MKPSTLLGLCGYVAAASLDLSLTSNWGTSSFFVQLVESVAGRNESLYVPVIRAMILQEDGEMDDWEDDMDGFGDDSNESTEVPVVTDRDLYAKAVSHLSLVDVGFTNLNLVNKLYSPRIEAHYLHFRKEIEPNQAAAVAKKCSVDSFGEALESPLGAWVKYGDKIYCSESDLYALQTSKFSENAFAFDRVVGHEGPLLVLYGDPDCSRFAGMFNTLLQFAESGRLRFSWRYVPNKEIDTSTLSGYGVSLVAKDKREKSIGGSKPVGKILKYLRAKAKDSYLTEIPEDRLYELSLKVASYVLQEPKNPENLLKEILHNLPLYAPSLLEAAAPPNYGDVKASAAQNEQKGAGYESVGLYINGAMTHRLETDLPNIVQKLTHEVALIEEMVGYGFSEAQAKLIFSKFALLSAFKEAEFRTGSSDNRFAVYRDIHVPGDANSGGVVFFNDIQNDDSYNLFYEDRKEAYLETALQLRVGQIPSLRENVHDIIFVLNFSNRNQLKVFFMLSKVILDRALPQQLGVIPIVENEKDALIAEKFYYIMKVGEPKEALAFLYKYYEALADTEDDLLNKVDVPLDESALIHHYKRTINKYSITEPSVIINGVIHNMRSSNWQAAMGKQIAHDVRLLQQKIRDELDVGTPLKDILYEDAKTIRNTRVVPLDPANIRYKKVSHEMLSKAHTFTTVQDTGAVSEISGTFWLIGDFNSYVIMRQLVAILKFMDYMLKPLQIKVLLTYKSDLLALLSEEYQGTLTSEMISEIISKVESTKPSESEIDYEIRSLLEKNHIQVHLPSLLINSRYFRLSTVMSQDDLQLLLEYEFSQRLGIFDEITNAYPDSFLWKPVMKFKKERQLSGLDWFDLVSSTVSNSFFLEDSMLLSDVSRFDFSSLNYQNSVDLTGYDAKKPIDILVIIDPLDEFSQKLVSISKSLSDLPFVNALILIVPLENEGKSYKLDRFYNDAFTRSKPEFDNEGSLVEAGKVNFDSLPSKVHFTAELDIPSRWYAIKGKDSDLVDLSSFKVDKDILVEYNLTKLIVEGYVKDVLTAKSIPGLTIEASNGIEKAEGYTLQNLGYMQMQLSPGEWQLLLKKGSSKDYYDLLSANDNKYDANDEGIESTQILVSSLSGTVIHPRISKKDKYPLDDAFSTPIKKTKTSNADINVFSIASGHTYENLMSIMMLSVKKHTKKPVKFWLLENFLSTHFTEQLPLMAKEYGFEYELVRYKWPLWLRMQSQLHRSVWGFKILFLDALFPASLEKVIFVDADQIARTDLSALANLDLEGAAYGFPPMCESRDDMEGYRFWKQGYWKEVLQEDLKYHISALYVVDLKQFRRNLVGDRLRTHYQKLSSDPNSLSNLDQDLPNNLQRQVPIFSLPQDWLWCETWCSAELKNQAKMIDLCNDPTSPEGKLQRARRLIPEWEGYSKELQKLGKGHLGTFHDEL